MEIDPKKLRAVPQQPKIEVNGLTTLEWEKLPDGSRGQVRGCVYVSINNTPQGHVEVQCASMDAFKMHMNAMGQWIAQHDKGVIIKPNGVG